MRHNGLPAILATAVLALASPAWSLPASTIDLWDVSQGTVVTANTAVLDYGGLPFLSDRRNMFGFTQAGSIETVNTLFSDFTPEGFVHSIEWQTAAPITLRSFNLIAHHDGPGGTRDFRGMDSFKLFYFDGVAFSQIFAIDLTGSPEYDPLGLNAACHCVLILESNVAPVTSNRFRAEFVQAGPPSNRAGIRIVELDGYNTFLASSQVPEPATLAILGVGLAMLGLLRRRRTA